MSSSSLGKWVDKIFDDIFYQPDDELALKAFEESISPDLQVRINGKALTRDIWKSIVFDTRSKDNMSVLTIRELLAIEGDSEVGIDGSVSHISTFAFTDKQTGLKKAESTSVTVITAAWKNGKRIVTDLTEMLI